MGYSSVVKWVPGMQEVLCSILSASVKGKIFVYVNILRITQRSKLEVQVIFETRGQDPGRNFINPIKGKKDYY